MRPIQLFTRHLFRHLSIVIALTFILTTAPTALGRQNPPPRHRNSCLWSLHTSRNTVYLLGSLHLLDRHAYPLAPAIEKAYQDSQRIIFETDIAAMNDPRIQTKMLQLGLYSQGETLYQHLDGSTRRLLDKKLSQLGLLSEGFASFKPWFAALTLSVLELQRLGFTPNYGIDVYFFNKAKDDNKITGFLELPEYQLDLLGNMDMHNQELFLRQTLRDLELVTESAGNMVRYWEAGDVDNLYALLFKSFADYPDIHDRLLLQRNKKWVATVEQFLKQSNNVLFIVGVGHLVGPGSVVDLLQKRGYNVKQR
jgi:uncharacterized protein